MQNRQGIAEPWIQPCFTPFPPLLPPGFLSRPRLSFSLLLSRFRGGGYTCWLRLSLSPRRRSLAVLPISLPPALAGEGGWCEVAGAVVTGASELRGEVFKQGRAGGARRGHDHSLSLSTVPLLGLDGNSWGHLRPNGSGLHAAFPHQIPLPLHPQTTPRLCKFVFLCFICVMKLVLQWAIQCSVCYRSIAFRF